MTHREGSASVSMSRNAPAANPAGSPGTGSARSEHAPRHLSWDDLFRGLTPGQQEELLGLARRQGVLYGNQIPGLHNGAAADPVRGLLGRLLSGRIEELQPLHPAELQFVDGALDSAQRAAVAGALATPDVFLIQGLPGTGKSRVIAEIILQAAQVGQRVLLLAATGAALDRVLERLAPQTAICAVRCLEKGERPETLAPTTRGFTLAEQIQALREQTVSFAHAKAERHAKETQRLQQDERVWEQFEALATEAVRLEQSRLEIQARRHDCPAQVRSEAEAELPNPAPTPFLSKLLDCRQRRAEARQKGNAQAAACLQERDALLAQMAELTAEKEKILPLAEAKHQGQWWTVKWWQAALSGLTEARWQELQTSYQKCADALAALEPRAEAAAQAAEDDDHKFERESEAILAEEIARRGAELDRDAYQLEAAEAKRQAAWDHLSQGLAPATPRPTGPTVPEIAAARAGWETKVAQAVAEQEFAAEWAAHLAQTPDCLAERLPQMVNLVAATTAGLAADPVFGAAGKGYDLLIVDEANQVTESEFQVLSRRARRWVLVGEPPQDASALSDEPARSGQRPAGNRRWNSAPSSGVGLPPSSSLLGRLWQRLHFDPSRLPYSWVEEQGRLVCRLRPLTTAQRASLEIERVADYPDIELRILAGLAGKDRASLAEVAFPPVMSIADAKRYIYHELQELPLHSVGHQPRWIEAPDRLTLQLADLPLGKIPSTVVLEPGVREMVGHAGANGEAPAGPWLTCCLEFDREAGWHRQRAQEWLARHAGVRDLGRTARLTIPYRMTPEVARFVADLLPGGASWQMPPRTLGAGTLTGVEFIPVPAPARDRNGRGRDRPQDWAAQLTHLRGGAGLELSLEDPKHRDRIPSEVRNLLPGRGLVNYLEAQAVVRTLATLATTPSFVEGLAALAAAENEVPSVAVLALHPTQAMLIRHLARQAPQLATARFHITVETPSSFLHRDALVVLVSLTRSHTHRAVPFGHGADSLSLALTRARARLLLFGDPGTLVRRTQWEGSLDHQDAAEGARERELIARLLRYLQGQGAHPEVFALREGTPA